MPGLIDEPPEEVRGSSLPAQFADIVYRLSTDLSHTGQMPTPSGLTVNRSARSGASTLPSVPGFHRAR